MEFFFQNLINALQLGSFYALIAVGYSMVYGVLLLFNFAFDPTAQQTREISGGLLWIVFAMAILIETLPAPRAFKGDNPTASMMLFDPQLVLLGPSAYVILDNFGRGGYIAWALVYPGLLGLLSAWLGYSIFRRGDLP